MTLSPGDTSEGQPGPLGFRFIDPRDEKTYLRLRLIGPGPAAFFRDACQMMGEREDLETRGHLVAHCLREIESAIRQVLGAVVPAPRKQKNLEGHRAQIQTILAALELDDDPVAGVWLALADNEHTHALHRLAHRDSLRAPRPVDADFRQFFDGMMSVLAVVTTKIEERIVTWFAFLEGLAKTATPSGIEAAALRQQVPNNNVTLSFFFDQISDAAWIDPLRDEGFFAIAPGPIRDPDSGTVRFPGWPEMSYLARVSSQSPAIAAKVVEIIVGVDDSANDRAHYQMIEVLLNCPAAAAAKAVPTVCGWLLHSSLFLVGDKAGELMAHLAKGGEGAAAMHLGEALLRLGGNDVES